MEIREDLGPQRLRAALLLLAVLLALGALHLRLAQLQLVDGATWHSLAENNRLRLVPLPCFRGRVYDCHGQVLADNQASWQLLLFPADARDLDRTILFLARLGVDRAAALHQRLVAPGSAQAASILLDEDLSWEQVARVRVHQSELPELTVVSGFRRTYPLGPLAAHAVGHLRMVSREELERTPNLGRSAMVGANGVEEQWNAALAGRDGERWVVVDAVGQQLGVVRETSSRAGRDLTVTLDAGLQQVAADALGSNAGAVVALEPSTGAVRVLYSAPSFDPNLFSARLGRREWEALRNDPGHPLQNRCLQGAYPPGSTIKPFLSLGALSEGVVTPEWGVSCSGSVTLYGHPFRCWRKGGHGGVALRRSLEVSCDTYYYLLGQRLGIDRIARWLGAFGFGQVSGLGFAAENPGLVGTPEWSLRVRRQPWYAGDAVSVSIGQGPILATTMQLARAFGAIANRAVLVTPRVVVGPEEPARRRLDIDPAHLDLVAAALWDVVHGGEGTARRLAGLPAAGKTGTAQVARLQEGVKVEDLPLHLRHHAWFVGYAPAAAPELVVAVLVEHGGGGGSVAAPVAERILRAALGGDEAGAAVAGAAGPVPPAEPEVGD